MFRSSHLETFMDTDINIIVKSMHSSFHTESYNINNTSKGRKDDILTTYILPNVLSAMDRFYLLTENFILILNN